MDDAAGACMTGAPKRAGTRFLRALAGGFLGC